MTQLQGFFEKNFTLSPDYCGASARMSPLAAFTMFQAIAAEHAERIGVGGAAMARRGAFWLTLHSRVDFFRWPALAQEVTAATWPEHCEGRSLRCFRSYSLRQGDQLLALGRTQWAVLGENLKGVVISLSIGMLVYFLLIRPLLTERRDGEIRYRSLWPAWLSLEESVYKPFFRWLIRVLMTLCRVACDLLDLLVLVMRRTLLRDTRDHVRRSPHSSVVRAMSHNSKYSQEETADHVGTVLDTFQRMEGSLSFALLMACLGLCLILLCVILHVFG